MISLSLQCLKDEIRRVNEIVNEANRAFVFETGPIRPLIDFPQLEQAGRKFKFKKRWYEEFN